METRFRALDWWIRAGTTNLPPQTAREIQKYNSGQLLGAVTALGFVGFWLLAGSSIMTVLSAAWVTTAIGNRLWLYHRPEDLQTVISATLGIGLGLLFFASLFTGTSTSAFMVFMLSMPVLAAYRTGASSAVLWTLVCCALIVALFGLDEVAPIPPVAEVPPFVQALAWCATAALLCVFAVAQRNSWDASQQELAIARDEALAAADQRMRFLNRMSHEIRTPLHGAIGMSEMLLRTQLDASQREAASVVRRSAAGLVDVVDRVLDLARLDADALELVLVEFDVLAVVEDALDLFAVQAFEKRIRLGLVVADAVPAQVLGDPLRVRQVLVNLLGNAMKYTDAGHVTLQVDQVDGQLTFEVRDTGAGIAPELLDQLFVPFWQVDPAVASRVGGAGLGLALSRNLAQRMDGDIVADSAPGRGSTFTFTGRMPGAAANAWEGRPPRARALLVDEQADSTPLTVVAMARRVGVVFDVVPSVPVEPREVDLLAVGVRSLEALDSEAIRGQVAALRRVAPSAPVLLVSSIAERRIAPEAASLGFDHVLFEPVRRSAIERIVEPASPSETRRTSPHHALSVLVVDDNPVNRKVAALMCQRLGHEVHAVDSGEAAIVAVKDRRWDVVLMDVMMPGMSGVEATRRIREEMEEGPPIFALSATDEARVRRECHEAGMVGHLKKPLTVDDLRRALADSLASVEWDTGRSGGRDAREHADVDDEPGDGGV